MKYVNLESRAKQMGEEIKLLKARESSWEEKLKSVDQKCLSELERLHQTNKEDLKKY